MSEGNSLPELLQSNLLLKLLQDVKGQISQVGHVVHAVHSPTISLLHGAAAEPTTPWSGSGKSRAGAAPVCGGTRFQLKKSTCATPHGAGSQVPGGPGLEVSSRERELARVQCLCRPPCAVPECRPPYAGRSICPAVL